MTCGKYHIPSILVVGPESFTMVLRLQRVTPIMSPQLTRPDDLGVIHGYRSQTGPRKPHHHRGFSERSDLLSAPWRWEGVSRVRVRLPPIPGLSAETPGDLSRRRVPDAPLPLCPCPPGWGHHLAYP